MLISTEIANLMFMLNILKLNTLPPRRSVTRIEIAYA